MIVRSGDDESKPEGESLAIPGVARPRSIAEWAVDATHRVRIGSWEPALVNMTVTSSATGQPVIIPVMRLYLSEFDGQPGAWEWNMASKQGMAVLNELLLRPDIRELVLEVTRQGAPPKTRWAINIVS